MAADAGQVELEVVPGLTSFGPALLGGLPKILQPVEAAIKNAFGGTLAAGIAAGFAAIGVAAVHMASEFEDSMNRIQALVGLTGEETEKIGNDILDLATKVPAAPKELADAMFFIESAGLRGARAAEALEYSAKAAAAGLGDTMTVADAVTSAMNSYADSGLTAARATDIMIAAVREGKLPPEDLAQVLGQVLPVAASVGVTFDQVAASIASATRQGLSAARAATGVRFLLTSFIKPSGQAVEALSAVGLSIGDVQRHLAEDGLLNTLQLLAKRFDTSTVAGKQMFATVVGGARGMSVASILIGQNAEAIEAIFTNVKDSVGDTEKAFATAMKTLTNQFKLIVSSFQSAMIKLGNAILPVITAIVHALGTVLSPVLAAVGRNAKVFAAAMAVWVTWKIYPAILAGIGRALRFLTANFLSAAKAAGYLEIAMVALSAKRTFDTTIDDVGTLGDKIGLSAKLMDELQESSTGFIRNITALAQGKGLADEFADKTNILKEALAGVAEEGYSIADSQDYLNTHVQDVINIFKKFSGDPTGAQEALQAAIERNTQSVEEQSAAVIESAGGWNKFSAGLEKLKDPLEALGMDFQSVTKAAEDAAEQGPAAFDKFSKELIANAAQAMDQLRSDLSSSLNFASSALQELSGKANASAEDYLNAFKKAGEATKKFGRDLLEIARHGGADLAQQLASMGSAGVHSAEVIAGASDKMRDHIIGAFNKGQGAADSLANKLTKQIAGTLNDIRDILNAIAKKWDITVDAHADGAFTTLEALDERLKEVTYKSWVANVRVTTSGGSTGFHLLEMLTEALRSVTEKDWHVNVRVSIGDDQLTPQKVFASMSKTLDKVGRAFSEFSQGVVSEFGDDLPKAYAKSLKELGKTVSEKIRMYDKLVSKAQDTYDKIADAAEEFHDGIVAGFSDFADIVGTALDAISKAADEGGPLDLSKTLQEQVAAAQKFADELLRLQDLGLDKDLLAQIAAQGPAAEPLIAQLLGDPALVQQFNDAFGAINDIASQTAESLTDANFGAALQEAADAIEKFQARIGKFSDRVADQVEKFIKGLQAQKLGDHVTALITAIRRALSQLGVNVPHLAEGGIITKPTLLVAGEAGNEAIVPLDKMTEVRSQGPTEIYGTLDTPFGPAQMRGVVRQEMASQQAYGERMSRAQRYQI